MKPRCPRNMSLLLLYRRMQAPTDECIVWPYKKGGQMGYGRVTIGPYATEYAHRIAWVLTFGRIPKGLNVLHHCDNPPCFNPRHLFVGTPADNNKDAAAKNRTCKGTKNGVNKLTEQQVRDIRRLYKHGVRGFGQEALGKQFGVHRIAIRKILRRQMWGWLQ